MCKEYDFEKFSKKARRGKAYWKEMEKLKKENKMTYWEMLDQKNKFPDKFILKKEKLKEIVHQAYKKGREYEMKRNAQQNPDIFDIWGINND